MRYVTQGDFLRLFAYVVLVIGVCRAILASELGRAVAEERGRVAREIHDGLSQYLFAISTHAAMIEAGASVEETVPKLRDAVQAAQTEARFAVLALSSAAGRAPFDAALRRYVDFLTADGMLEVELEIDGEVEPRARRADRGVPHRSGGARERPPARACAAGLGRRSGCAAPTGS